VPGTLPTPSHPALSHPTAPPPLRASDRSNVVPCFMPDFMHCMAFEYGVDAEGMFDTGESIPSRSSFAFPGSVSRLFHAVRSDFVARLSYPSTWRMVESGTEFGGSLLETMEGRFEAGERCWSPGPPGRRRGSVSPAHRPFDVVSAPAPASALTPCPRPPFAAVSIRCHVPGACDWPVQRPSVSRVPPKRAVFRRALQTLFC
jgi:hypothetical protein